MYSVSSGLWRASGIKWKKKKKREEIERAGELLESSSGSKGKIKEERMKEWGASGKWSCGSKEKEKGEDVDKIMYTCVVDKIQEKKKRKRKRMEEKKGKVLEIKI